MNSDIAILQFGTSRFLLAHADLFISEAFERGEAMGRIAVVQTTDSAESLARVAALAGGAGYPVRIRGLKAGAVVDETRQGGAIGRAINASTDWADIRRLALGVSAIISNTGDRGYDLDPADGPALLEMAGDVPRSFPAKLTVLLAHRWRSGVEQTLSIFPCELIEKNGERMKALVLGLSQNWDMPDAFRDWLNAHCRFANSLVDRIVSEAIAPVGAVAEPYALWAIEKQDGLTLPCRHQAITLADRLDEHERLKLQLLNLGHTYLAERWLIDGRAPGETVLQAMDDPVLRADLENLWASEVLPVFAADGLEDQATAYLESVRERFLNPFLAHRIHDIAANHAEKKRRRLLPVIERAEKLGLRLAQVELRASTRDLGASGKA